MYPETSGNPFQYTSAVLNREQEAKSINLVRVEVEKNIPRITVCHHSPSLVMPNSDPRNEFFNPTLTLMMDSYNLKSVPITPYLLVVKIIWICIFSNVIPD